MYVFSSIPLALNTTLLFRFQIRRYNAIDISVSVDCTILREAKFLLGRCPRRLGMETCPWGGFSLSKEPIDVGYSGWQWSSTLFHGCCYSWLDISASTVDDFTYNLLPLVFALLGFLSPSNRGSLATVMMVCWTIFGRFVSLTHLLLFSFPDKILH